jgi:Erv1 / Alr family
VKISFHAVSCTAHKKICQKLGIKSYPSVRLFPAGDVNGTEVTYWKLHPFQVLQSLGVETEELGGSKFSTTSKHDGANPNPISLDSGTKDSRKRSKEELFSDAMLSFDFSIRNSIFMSTGPLTNKTFHVFYDWLELLQESLPPQWNIHKPIHALIENYDNVSKSEASLVQMLDQHQQPDHSTKWTEACTHGDNFAGYTCGLWELFHIMTIGVVEWNNVVTNEWSLIPINHAADTLHDYIANFFACDVCRKNFMTEYDACAHERCTRLASSHAKDWKQLPLWLWEMHNSVNVRLVKEQAERDGKLETEEDEIRVQWPSRLDCPQCWGKDGAWDEDFIYKYIRMEYWPEDTASASFRRELQLSMPTPELEESIEDNSSSAFRLPLAFSIIPLLIMITATIAHCIRKRKRDVTGRHKKSDGYYRNGLS